MIKLLESLSEVAASGEDELSWNVSIEADDTFTDKGHGEFSQESGGYYTEESRLNLWWDGNCSSPWASYEIRFGEKVLEHVPVEGYIEQNGSEIILRDGGELGDVVVSGTVVSVVERFNELLKLDLDEYGVDSGDMIADATHALKLVLEEVFES